MTTYRVYFQVWDNYYTDVEASSEEEAKEKANELSDDELDWVKGGRDCWGADELEDEK